MATVIYQPRDTRYGEIGQGISKGTNRALEIMQKQKNAENMAKFQQDVRAAGSREKALEVVTRYSPQFQNAQDYSIAFRTVDENWPATSTALKQITTYDSEGKETPRFVTESEARELTNDPSSIEKRYGPGTSLTKPDIQMFYRRGGAGEIEALGKHPVGSRPEGAYTMPEISEINRAEREIRAEREAAAREDRFRQTFDLQQRKFDELLKRVNERDGEKAEGFGRQLINDAVRSTAMALGGRVLPDGSFSFTEVNAERLFNERMSFIHAYASDNPEVLKMSTGGIALYNAAERAVPRPAPKEEPAKPPQKSGGGISDALGKLFGGKTEDKPKEKPKPIKPAAKGDAGPTRDKAAVKKQIEERAKQINARTDLLADEKRRALQKLKEIARDNGVEVKL